VYVEVSESGESNSRFRWHWKRQVMTMDWK